MTWYDINSPLTFYIYSIPKRSVDIYIMYPNVLPHNTSETLYIIHRRSSHQKPSEGPWQIYIIFSWFILSIWMNQSLVMDCWVYYLRWESDSYRTFLYTPPPTPHYPTVILRLGMFTSSSPNFFHHRNTRQLNISHLSHSLFLISLEPRPHQR